MWSQLYHMAAASATTWLQARELRRLLLEHLSDLQLSRHRVVVGDASSFQASSPPIAPPSSFQAGHLSLAPPSSTTYP